MLVLVLTLNDAHRCSLLQRAIYIGMVLWFDFEVHAHAAFLLRFHDKF